MTDQATKSFRNEGGATLAKLARSYDVSRSTSS